MEKENGETSGGDPSKGNDASSLLDAASLFGAYWGRDPSALLSSYGGGATGFGLLGAAAAAAAAQGGGGSSSGGGAGGSSGGGGGGSGGSGGRYPPSSTLSVAASQAASLGLHPAASAAWWSMASQLAAQDYLARLQASGLGAFPPGVDPYGLAAAAGLVQAQSRGSSSGTTSGSGQGTRGRPPGSSRGPHNRTSHSMAVKDKDKNSLRSSYGLPKTSSPSMSSMQGLSALGLNSLAGSRTPTLSSHSPQPPHSSSSSSKHSRKSSAAAKASALSGAYLGGVTSKSSSSGTGGNSGSNNAASSPSPSSSSAKDKDISSMMRSDLLMAQAAMAQNAYQAAVAQQQGKSGKNSSSLYGNPFGLGSLSSSSLSEKDKHSGLDSLANLPHTILSAALEGSDGASILGGVRLPPDTEIIKYTSSIVGPKVPGTTNRGRKKTISLDPPQVSVHPALSSTGLLVERGGPPKRPKLESEYSNPHAAHQNSSITTLSGGGSGSDRVEVIKLPSGSTSDTRSSSTPFSMSSYTGLSKELLQSIANQSGLNLAALEKQFAQQFGSSSSYPSKSSSYTTNPDIGLNLSAKSTHSSSQPQRDESPASTANDDDAPLNLSLKPTTSKSSNDDWKSSNSSSSRLPDECSNSLNSLTNITASLGGRNQQPSLDRVSRRKPGAKPRRVIQESSPSPSHMPGQESPTPSGSEDSDMGPWHPTKEGRPRNLGRGVSKPKKNTVASLLAQSRALGIRPALAQQYLQEAADLLNPELQEKLKAAMNDMSAGLIPHPELSGTDSDGGPPGSDSCADDSDASDAVAAEPMLRLPLAMGWRRETLMKGLSRNGSIKGDVTYCPPEPRSNVKLKNITELMNYLEKNPSPPLQKENFSYSSKLLIGKFLQANGQEGMSETEVAKRLEEARRALSSASTGSLAVEQRIELARQQQAAREARKDAAKGREQARLAREQERSEKAEQAKREKEARNQQLLEAQIKQANESLKILNANEQSTIGFWKSIQAIASSSSVGGKQISVSMPSMSLTLTPVPSLTISPVPAPTNTSHSQWKEEYNALDRIRSFAETAALKFSPSKTKQEVKKDFKLIPVKQETKTKANSMTITKVKAEKPEDDQNKFMLNKVLSSYSRMNEFLSGKCAWAKNTPSQKKVKSNRLEDFKDIENRYLRAKNDYMTDNLTLLPNEETEITSVFQAPKVVEVIDLVDNEEEDLSKAAHVALVKKANDEALTAKRKRQEDIERQKQEELTRKQQERELKRQQTVMLKEQMYMAEVGKQRELIYTVELERERRRQHMALVKQLENRRRFEEKEKRKNRLMLDKLAIKEKKLEERKKEVELLKELRKPQEDSTLSDQKPLPTLNRIPGLKLPGQAMADILMVFEFINNFGNTLGFDMDTLPSLNTLQMALLPDCCTEAEEELLSILTHLLVCAIEDPGIPHPGRHTTILGHTLKNEVTPSNVSEVLRIYLYANATGEIKSLTGINPERDRERRVADHHQSDTDVQQQAHGRNSTYYTHLHNNPTWRLAEKLRHHPYLALNPTSKARILAMLCDELLQSKAVLRQIDQSLDSLSQLRKDRYMMDIKLRKLKMLHSRKVRMEAAEKQQALALERMQKMVEENEMTAITNAGVVPAPIAASNNNAVSNNDKEDGEEQHNAEEEKNDAPAISDTVLNEDKKPIEVVTNHEETSDMEVVVMGAPPLKEIHQPIQPHALGKSSVNNGTKEDKDSVMGDTEIILSDVESEGTQPEEDEDKILSAEELSRKLEKLIRQSDTQLQNLILGAHSIRATCYGQDRYWRRYWSLSKCGGIFVEGMESTQPEIMAYHEKMEECAKKREEGEAANRLANKKTRNKKGPKPKTGQEAEAAILEACNKNTEMLLQNELELRNIKSELNLSDHTRIIKYEPNMGHKVQGSPIKMEEKHIQQQKVAEDHLLDIEDSIPTAFLVQKPLNSEHRKSVYPTIEGDKVETPIKTENVDVKVESNIKNEQENSQNSLDNVKVEKKEGNFMNNLEELKKLADSVVPPKDGSPSEIKQENNGNECTAEEKVEIKNELNNVETATAYLNNKMNDGKWFSILRKENPLAETNPSAVQQSNGVDEKDPNLRNGTPEGQTQTSSNIVTNIINSQPMFIDNTQTCSEICILQGNRWDVCNNLHLLTNPQILFTNTNLQCQQITHMNSFQDPDCTMTMSGLDEDMIDVSVNSKQDLVNETIDTTVESVTKDVIMNHIDESIEQSINCMDTSDVNSTCDKSPNKNLNKSKINSSNVSIQSNAAANFSMSSMNNSCGGMNISAMTAYVTCDSPAPLQITQEESEQLEYCKLNGLPKKLEGNFVPKDLRYGWWRITDTDQLKEILTKLHPRGVRERDLHNSFMLGLLQTNNKIHIEKGDLLATELSISHLDRVIALNGGFPSPDSASSFSVKTARRIDQALLEQIEALEERVAAASMQIKGWKPPPHTTPAGTPPHCEEQTTVVASRSRLLSLEAAIERRYLRPPLGAAPPCPPANANTNTNTGNAASQDVDSKDEDGQAQREVTPEPKGPTSIPRGLSVWREGTSRCQTSAQLAMVLQALEAAIAWDKSIMKANCQFCQSGDNEDKLLLCDGCDKGYHTYCFKPKMDKIPDGDWYCFECLNKATGDRVCIVCGGKSGNPPPGSTRGGRLVPCALCPRAYHQDCHYPPLNKVPRSKWYCVKCIVKAPPKKPRNTKKARNNSMGDSFSDSMQPPSPAPSQASNTTNEDCPITSALMNQSSLSSVQSTPEKVYQPTTVPPEINNQHFSAINNIDTVNDNPVPKITNDSVNDAEDFVENDKYYEIDDNSVKNNESNSVYEDFKDLEEFPDTENSIINKRQSAHKMATGNGDDVAMDGDGSCGTVENDSNSGNNSEEYQSKGESVSDRERESRHCKKDRSPYKRLNKELGLCKTLLEEMELHDDSWPFLLPVNTKQFPTYKKIIRTPMDLSTIKRKLQEMSYKSKEEFACDVRQIFHNCEVFNEDESPVGRAGHGMRRFFEERWANVI